MSLHNLTDRYGRWAMVTGSAHGLGRAFAAALAARGFDVVLIDIDADANNALADELRRRTGVQADSVVLDVRSPELAERSRADSPSATGKPSTGTAGSESGRDSSGGDETTSDDEVVNVPVTRSCTSSRPFVITGA